MPAYANSDLAYADVLRDRVDAAEYKRIVLGLLFFKYISNAFENHKLA